MEKQKQQSVDTLQGGPCFPWLGGKRRLLQTLTESLPEDLGQMKTYVEPFVGGGALFF